MTLDIKRLRELCDAATPGPWCVQGPWPQATIYVHDYAIDEPIDDQRTQPTHIATAQFIAAARTALPAALDEIEALRAEIERLKAALREAIDLAQHAIANLGAQHDDGLASNAYTAVARLAQLAKEAE